MSTAIETTGQHQTPLRDRLLEAAAKVYGECGFRGATTRLIAETAGVNEVTLFRLFGSKTALIHEAIKSHAHPTLDVRLPDEPVAPLAELTLWAQRYMEGVRHNRGLVLNTMGELAERAELIPPVCAGMEATFAEIAGYLDRLPAHGFTLATFDREAAVSMLLGTLFSDAMGREMVPHLHPQPLERAAEQYVRLFLRAIGLSVAADAGGSHRSGSPA